MLICNDKYGTYCSYPLFLPAVEEDNHYEYSYLGTLTKPQM